MVTTLSGFSSSYVTCDFLLEHFIETLDVLELLMSLKLFALAHVSLRWICLIWLLILIGHLYLSGMQADRCDSKNEYQNDVF